MMLDFFAYVETSDRVSKKPFFLPRGTYRAAVPTILENVSFQFQVFYNLLEVGCHDFNLPSGLLRGVPKGTEAEL
jgi:hypothetical protein